MSASDLKAVATGQATAQEARDPYSVFKMQLEKAKLELLPLLGNSRHNVDAFVRVVLTAVSNNPDLLDADRRSLLSACTRAAQDGNMPDGREAVLNVYSTKVRNGGREEWIKKVEYLPMVAGMVKALYAHPDILMVDAAAVYENDLFKFRRGDDPRLEHEPTMEDDAGQVICAYLVVKLANGQIKREVMARRDIERVRGTSKSPDGANSPWTKWYDQQAIKSVIKRGAKQLPRSNKFDQVEAADNESPSYAGAGGYGEVLRQQGSAQTAITHQAADPLEQVMPGTSSQAEMVERIEQAAQVKPAARAAAHGKTYAKYIDDINAAKDQDAAAIVVDLARSVLPEDQVKDLAAHNAKRWAL